MASCETLYDPILSEIFRLDKVGIDMLHGVLNEAVQEVRRIL